MNPTKHEFMQEMTVNAYNRHRRQMGLEPVSYAQMESSSSERPTEAPDQSFDGKVRNPVPLGGGK